MCRRARAPRASGRAPEKVIRSAEGLVVRAWPAGGHEAVRPPGHGQAEEVGRARCRWRPACSCLPTGGASVTVDAGFGNHIRRVAVANQPRSNTNVHSRVVSLSLQAFVDASRHGNAIHAGTEQKNLHTSGPREYRCRSSCRDRAPEARCGCPVIEPSSRIAAARTTSIYPVCQYTVGNA